MPPDPNCLPKADQEPNWMLGYCSWEFHLSYEPPQMYQFFSVKCCIPYSRENNWSTNAATPRSPLQKDNDLPTWVMTFSILRPHMLRSLALNDAFWSAILTHIHPCFPQLMVDGNPKPFEPSSICSWEHVWTSRSRPEWFHNFRYGAWHFCAPMDLTKTPLLTINVEQMIGPIPLYVFREAGISKNIISHIITRTFFPQYHGPTLSHHVWWLNGY